jgi:hypothetical protein
MLRLALAGAVAAATLCAGVASTPATAHRWHHHWHHWYHHVWDNYEHGNGTFAIIRWSYGDCKIWHDDGGAPVGVEGTDWVLLRVEIPTYERALYRLGRLQEWHVCS